MDRIEELRYLIKAAEKEGENNYRKMLAGLEITPSQNEVLKILRRSDGLSVSEIGELLICGSDSPSRVIQRLVLKGLVEKRTDQKDTRKTLLYLTKSGLDLLGKTDEVEKEFNQSIATIFSRPTDIDLFIQVLNKQVSGTKSHEQIENRKQLEE